MIWLFYSLASTLAFTFISALDKIIIDRFSPSPRAFIVLVGLTQFVLTLVLAPVASWSGYGVQPAALGYASGLASGSYLALMFWVMGRQDVSRVIPVTSTYPIFVALLAQAFLDEPLGAAAWAGVIVTVCGAALMSLGPTQRGESSARSQMLAFGILLLASLGFGLSQLLSKPIVDDMNVWTIAWWRTLGTGTVCAALVFRRGAPAETLAALRRPATVGMVLLTEGALVLLALILLLAAIDSGPVSLVSTAMATRPLFVFLLGAALSVGARKALNEPLEPKILAVKAASIAMSVGGVAVVTLAGVAG